MCVTNQKPILGISQLHHTYAHKMIYAKMLCITKRWSAISSSNDAFNNKNLSKKKTKKNEAFKHYCKQSQSECVYFCILNHATVSKSYVNPLLFFIFFSLFFGCVFIDLWTISLFRANHSSQFLLFFLCWASSSASLNTVRHTF